jgi:WD40 repeat protein
MDKGTVMKRLLKTLLPMLCGLLSVSFVAAQEDCPEDIYLVLANGEAYSINNPDAEPRSLISDVSVYLPEAGYVDGDDPFWMDYSNATHTLAFTNGARIFLFDSDDEAPRQLTLDDTEGHDYLEFEALAWSPDGQSLAVAVLENTSEYNLPTRMTILIYEVAEDSWREAIEVMYEELGLLTYLEILRWSPDGSAIAFSLDTIIQIRFYTTHYFDTACFDEGECEHSEILMRPANNEDGYPENRYAPDWSPDGSRLGFICGDDLCIFDRESRQVERLEEFDIVDEFMWMPCGNRIVYQSEDANILVRDLDSGEERTLVTIEQSAYLFQMQEMLGLLPMPDAAFLFENSGA